METYHILNASLKLQTKWRSLLGDPGALQVQSLLQLAAEDETQHDQIANQILELFAQHGAREALIDEMPLGPSPKGVPRLLLDMLPGDPGPVAPLGTRYCCPESGCHSTWTPQRAGERVPHCQRHNCLLEPC